MTRTLTVTKQKIGRSRLTQEAEVVDLDTGIVVAVTIQASELSDPTTMEETLKLAREQFSAIRVGARVRELMSDKRYLFQDTAFDLKHLGLKSYASEPERAQQRWQGHVEKHKAVYANPRRIRGAPGKQLQHQRSERVVRPFARQFEKGGSLRIFARGTPMFARSCWCSSVDLFCGP